MTSVLMATKAMRQQVGEVCVCDWLAARCSLRHGSSWRTHVILVHIGAHAVEQARKHALLLKGQSRGKQAKLVCVRARMCEELGQRK